MDSCIPLDLLSLRPDQALAECDCANGPHDARVRLLGTVSLLGVPHHLEAIEVNPLRRSGTYFQEPRCQVFERSLRAMYDIGGDAPFTTVEVEGRPYVLNVVPHSM